LYACAATKPFTPASSPSQTVNSTLVRRMGIRLLNINAVENVKKEAQLFLIQQLSGWLSSLHLVVLASTPNEMLECDTT